MNLPQANEERRREQRARISVAVKQRVGSRVQLCQAGNISSSGLLLATVFDALLPEPSKCWLEFSLPLSEQTISARATVVRQERKGHFHLMAVAFSTIAPSHRRAIERYLEGDPFAASLPAFAQPD